jgi:hypothetical protein
MLKLLLKKSRFSFVVILIAVITSLFLYNEFSNYIRYFPIDSQDELVQLSQVGGASDFVRLFYRQNEEDQLQIMKAYYAKIISSESEFNEDEEDFIRDKYLSSETMDVFRKHHSDMYFSALEKGREHIHERYYLNLEAVSGESFEDVNERIAQANKEGNVSKYFAMRFMDRQGIIWGICLFALGMYMHVTLFSHKHLSLMYAKSFASYKYILNICLTQFIIILTISFIQMLTFALVFTKVTNSVYVSLVSDFISVYLLWFIPSMVIAMMVINFLYMVFKNSLLVFPLYFIFFSISSKISDEGFTIELFNLFLRYDTLFENLTALQVSTIFYNRIIMCTLSIMLFIFTAKIFDSTRNGSYNFELRFGRGIK